MDGIPKKSVASSAPFRFLVGPSATEYTIHSDLVALQSPALRALVNGCFEESASRCVRWDDIDEEPFLSFWEFVYTGEYEVSDETYTSEESVSSNTDPSLSSDDEAAAAHHVRSSTSLESQGRKRRKLPITTWRDRVLGPEYHRNVKNNDYPNAFVHHARVYVLADRYGIARLMNLSIHKLGTVLKDCTGTENKVQGIAALLRFCYTELVPERLTRLATHHAADNFRHLWQLPDFQQLLDDHATLSKTMLELFLPLITKHNKGDEHHERDRCNLGDGSNVTSLDQAEAADLSDDQAWTAWTFNDRLGYEAHLLEFDSSTDF